MKFSYKRNPEQWRAAARSMRNTIAGATQAAFRDLAKQVQQGGRAEIARGGFSRRWQIGFVTSLVPPRPTPGAIGLTMRGRHRAGFMNVFERGASIRGKPLLWIPTSAAPARIGGKRPTPRRYQQQIGRLQFVRRAGKPALLMGQSLKAIAPGRHATVSQLRTGARHSDARRGGQRGRRTVSVPMFVGMPAVRIRDRFDVSAVYERGRQALPGLYAKRVAELNR